MKINKLLSFLLAGILLGHTVPAHSMDLSQFSPIVTGGLASGLLYAKKCIECNQRKKIFDTHKKSGKKLHSIELPPCIAADEDMIQKKLQDETYKNHAIKEIIFLPTKHKNYHAAFPQNIVYIPEDAYIALLYQNHPGCTKQTFITSIDDDSAPESFTQLYITGTNKDDAIVVPTRILNHSNATIAHEEGHIAHESGIKKLRVSCLWPLIWGLLSQTSSRSSNSSLLTQCITQLGFAGLSYSINQLLNIAYGKYDEIRADDSIPNNHDLLHTQKLYFQDMHETEITAVKTNPHQFKTLFSKLIASTIPQNYWKQYPHIAMELLHATDDHPSHYFRMKRFQQRLSALENNTKN